MKFTYKDIHGTQRMNVVQLCGVGDFFLLLYKCKSQRPEVVTRTGSVHAVVKVTKIVIYSTKLPNLLKSPNIPEAPSIFRKKKTLFGEVTYTLTPI